MTTKQDIDRVEFFHEQIPAAKQDPAAHTQYVDGDLRWAYLAAGNSATMAGPEEGYKHLGEMIAAVERVTHRRITHDLDAAVADPEHLIFWSWRDTRAGATPFVPGVVHIPNPIA